MYSVQYVYINPYMLWYIVTHNLKAYPYFHKTSPAEWKVSSECYSLSGWNTTSCCNNTGEPAHTHPAPACFSAAKCYKGFWSSFSVKTIHCNLCWNCKDSVVLWSDFDMHFCSIVNYISNSSCCFVAKYKQVQKVVLQQFIHCFQVL